MFRHRQQRATASSSENDSESENISLNITENRRQGSNDVVDIEHSASSGKNIYNDDDIVRVEDGKYVFNPYNTENISTIESPPPKCDGPSLLKANSNS